MRDGLDHASIIAACQRSAFANVKVKSPVAMGAITTTALGHTVASPLIRLKATHSLAALKALAKHKGEGEIVFPKPEYETDAADRLNWMIGQAALKATIDFLKRLMPKPEPEGDNVIAFPGPKEALQ